MVLLVNVQATKVITQNIERAAPMAFVIFYLKESERERELEIQLECTLNALNAYGSVGK